MNQPPNFSLLKTKEDPFKPRSLNIQPLSTTQKLTDKNIAVQDLKRVAQNVHTMATQNNFQTNYKPISFPSNLQSVKTLDSIYQNLKKDFATSDLSMNVETGARQFFQQKYAPIQNFDQQIRSLKMRLQQFGQAHPQDLLPAGIQTITDDEFSKGLFQCNSKSIEGAKMQRTNMLKNIKDKFRQAQDQAQINNGQILIPSNRKLIISQKLQLSTEDLQDQSHVNIRAQEILEHKNYDLNYLNELLNAEQVQVSAQQKHAFEMYNECFIDFAESKIQSGKSSTSLFCQNLIKSEESNFLEDDMLKLHRGLLIQIWGILKNLSSHFQDEKAKPQLLDLLNFIASIDQKKPSSEYQKKIALITCNYLEQSFFQANFAENSIKNTMIQEFENEAFNLIEIVQQENLNDYEQLRSSLIMDNRTYPFVVILLLMRAGLNSLIQDFCTRHSIVQVQDFGELFKIYIQDQQLTVSQIMQFRQKSEQLGNDLCKDALISLMTGCVFSRFDDERIFYQWIFCGNLDDEIWFHLKLASFQLICNPPFDSEFADGYQPYSLAEFGHKIVQDLGFKHFNLPQYPDEINAIRYARILFLIGHYNLALNVLKKASCLVEATLMGVILKDMGLLATQAALQQSLRAKNEVRHTSIDQKLVQLCANYCINYDESLIQLAIKFANQKKLITFGLSLINLCTDQNLRQLAYANFIIENKFFELILESPAVYLDFKINKELTFRKLLGVQGFKSVTQQVAKQIKEEDPKLTITLHDKIQEHREVLNLMIRIMMGRERPKFFCDTGIKGLPEAYETQPRVIVEFNQILEAYRREGMEGQHKDLYDVLYQLDTITTAFDMLHISQSEMTKTILQDAFDILSSLKFIPSFKSSQSKATTLIQDFSSKFTKLDINLQEITPVVLICLSKLCWYLKKIVSGSSEQIVTNKKDLEFIQQMQDYQQFLHSAFESVVNNHGATYQSKFGANFKKAFETLTQIGFEMI